MAPAHLDFARPPHVGLYMTRAFAPRRARPDGGWPALTAVWRGAVLRPFVPGGAASAPGAPAHPVHLHAAGMRLMMALLTSRTFPLPIWRLLQVRCRLRQLRAIGVDEPLELTARTAQWRVLPKGLEVDLAVSARAGGADAFDAVTTFYARGRFGAAQEEPAPTAPAAPAAPGPSWRVPKRGVADWARLTGDYNGIHWSDVYARAFGFRGAFAHPQRVLAEVVDRAGVDVSRPLELEAWLKGPVYYERPATLALQATPRGHAFAVRVGGDERPALVGEVRGVA